MKRIKWNAPPNLAVIDRAIVLVGRHGFAYTCMALRRAVLEVEFDAVPLITMSVAALSNLNARRAMYTTQYRRYMFGPNDTRPAWWNSPDARSFSDARIAALKSFKQACIDAAKKGQP